MPQLIIQLLLKFKYYILLAVAVLTAAWWAWSPTPKKPEVYAPQQQQIDGSVVLEKKPQSDAKPAAAIPKGSTLIRKASITVQAKVPTATISGTFNIESILKQEKAMAAPVIAPDDKQPAEQLMEVSQDCPPVTVDLSLVEMPDKSQRVVASSADGNILGGVDIPVQNAEPQPDPKLWAAGVMISTDQNLGVFVDRDLGFLRLGAQINTTNGSNGVNGIEAWGKIGIRF